jgi:hypothetical protein
MSRGFGRVQRDLIEALRKHARENLASPGFHGMPFEELVSCAYYSNPGFTDLREHKEAVAVRRALRQLRKAGVVVDLGWVRGERCFALHYTYYPR